MGQKKRAHPRKNLTREERREQILQAALKAFTRGGYHGTHVDHIIREAGVARGTFYLHFQSKHAVFSALVDRTLKLILDAWPVGEEPKVKRLEDAEAILRTSYSVVLETFHEHRQLVRLLFEEAVGGEKGFRTKLDQHFQVWHRRVADTFGHFVERGVARDELDVEVTAEMVLGMVERLSRRYLFTSRKPDIPRLVDALVRFELGGSGSADLPGEAPGGPSPARLD